MHDFTGKLAHEALDSEETDALSIDCAQLGHGTCYLRTYAGKGVSTRKIAWGEQWLPKPRSHNTASPRRPVRELVLREAG